MKKSVLISALAIICFCVFSVSTNAQSLARNSVEVKSKEVSKTRGAANPNIKFKAPLTDDKPMADPSIATEGIEAFSCLANFENQTGLFVEVYVDGYYKGTLGAWGKMSVTLNADYKTIYCLSTGKSKEWNIEGKCADNNDFKLK